jgi:hypothetical protein
VKVGTESLMHPCARPVRCSRLLWVTQFLIGFIAGHTVGDAAVQTRCTMIGEPARSTKVRIESFILGHRVGDTTAFVGLPEDGDYSIDALGREESDWVQGARAIGAVLGVGAALGSAVLLRRQRCVVSGGEPPNPDQPAEPDVAPDRPR